MSGSDTISITITLYQSSEYAKGLNPSDGAKHIAKPVKCDVPGVVVSLKWILPLLYSRTNLAH